jgi:hypothetical protein
MSEQTITQKMGGRKATAFYASLAVILILAIMDKAETHILGLIDTLFLVYAGANVAKSAQAKPTPQTSDSMEKP